jgi:hypothetical protein
VVGIIPGRKRTRGKPLHKRPRYLRKGKCNRCGWCCNYRVCPDHLRFVDGKAVCLIYSKRPAECKRFPQAPPILVESCGFYFLDTWERNKKVKFGWDL